MPHDSCDRRGQSVLGEVSPIGAVHSALICLPLASCCAHPEGEGAADGVEADQEQREPGGKEIVEHSHESERREERYRRAQELGDKRLAALRCHVGADRRVGPQGETTRRCDDVGR